MKKLLKVVLCFTLIIGLLTGLVGCTTKKEDDSKNKGATAVQQDKKNDAKKIDFPTKPITMVVPWSVGGLADVFTRNTANYLEKNIGQPGVVTNRTGAGGVVALTEFKNAKSDGYTLQVASGSLFSIAPKFQPVQYKFEDFEPVIGQNNVEFFIVTNPEKSGIESWEDLVEYAKNNQIKYASGGPGNDTHTIQAGLFKMAGIDAETVTFPGGMDAINSLLGGHVEVSFGLPALIKDYVAKGSLKPIATFSPEGYTAFEGLDYVPTVKELGYDIQYVGINFLNVPAGTPEDVVDTLYETISKIYEDTEFKASAEKLSIDINPLNPQEIKAMIRSQIALFEELINLINE